MAFNRSGRLSVIVRTPSSPRSLRTVSYGQVRGHAGEPSVDRSCSSRPSTSCSRDRAADRPDVTWLRFRTGDLTFAEADRRVVGSRRGTGRPRRRRGDLVPVLMPNGPDIRHHAGSRCDRLGAVPTLLNTAFRGPALTHALNLTGAELLVVDAALADSIGRSVADELGTLRRPSCSEAATDPATLAPTRGRPGCPADRVRRRAPEHRRTAMTDPAMVHLHLGHDRAVEGLRALAPLRRPPGRADDRAPRAAGRRRALLPVPALPPRRHRADRDPGARTGHHGGHRRAVLGVGLLGRGAQRSARRCSTSWARP